MTGFLQASLELEHLAQEQEERDSQPSFRKVGGQSRRHLSREPFVALSACSARLVKVRMDKLSLPKALCPSLGC